MTDFAVNEKTSFCLNVVLKDKGGNPLNPIDKFEWWVSKPKDQLVYAKTEILLPEPEMEIIIPAEVNICEKRKDETRAVVFRVQSGENHIRHEVFPYTVTALDTVPYPTVEE
jgi:hypothetical protein